jgi:hypothetical protein
VLKVLAILAVILVVAQALVPIFGQAPDNGTKQTKAKENTANSQQHPAPLSGSFAVPDDAASRSARNGEKEQSSDINQSVTVTKSTPVSWLGKTSEISNIALAAVGIVGVIIALCSVGALRAQTQILVDNERGWLQVTLGKGTLPEMVEPNRLVVIWMFPTVTNQGRTACRLTKMYLRKRFCVSIAELPIPPLYEQEPGESSDSSILNAELLMVPNFPLTPLGIALSTGDIQTIRTPGKTLYLYGYIEYELGSLKRRLKRYTRFCFEYHIPGGYDPLPEGFLMPAGTPEYTRST